jgi:hypothetical protein
LLLTVDADADVDLIRPLRRDGLQLCKQATPRRNYRGSLVQLNKLCESIVVVSSICFLYGV